jgi:hypothetical protein
LNVPIPIDPEPPSRDEKGKQKEDNAQTLEDDGELGGEVAGRLVWEAFETGLKAWEKENPPPKEKEKGDGSVSGQSPGVS